MTPSQNKLSKDTLNGSKTISYTTAFVPHISEEIWSMIGGKDLCINEIWPAEEVKIKTNIKLAIQINGKTKE